jgi:hypothetical protein
MASVGDAARSWPGRGFLDGRDSLLGFPLLDSGIIGSLGDEQGALGSISPAQTAMRSGSGRRRWGRPCGRRARRTSRAWVSSRGIDVREGPKIGRADNARPSNENLRHERRAAHRCVAASQAAGDGPFPLTSYAFPEGPLNRADEVIAHLQVPRAAPGVEDPLIGRAADTHLQHRITNGLHTVWAQRLSPNCRATTGGHAHAGPGAGSTAAPPRAVSDGHGSSSRGGS